MDKKGIAEVKKCFKKEDCRIDRMVSCFVNEEGEVISRFSDSFYALEEFRADFLDLFFSLFFYFSGADVKI